MTTSGVTKFNSTGDEIIETAFSHIRVKQKGQALDAEDELYARGLLNNIIKNWQREGLHLWKDKEAALFLNINQRYYDVGEDINATNGDWVASVLAADVLIGASKISVASTSPLGYSGQTYTFAVGDTVGIENENNILEWFKITATTATTVTFNGTLTAASTTSMAIFVYRTSTDKPLKIYQENIRLWQSNNYELPLYMLAYTDYNLLPQKNITGTVVQTFYSPEIDTSRLTIWPTTDTVKNVLLFRYQSPLEIFSTGTNTADLPAEWIRVLGWALASELGPSYGLKPHRQQAIDARASNLYSEVLDWDQDNSSMFLQPRTWGMNAIGGGT